MDEEKVLAAVERRPGFAGRDWWCFRLLHRCRRWGLKEKQENDTHLYQNDCISLEDGVLELWYCFSFSIYSYVIAMPPVRALRQLNSLMNRSHNLKLNL